MALSHSRPYHRSAFAMDFLRPSMYINGESPTGSHPDSRRHSGEETGVLSHTQIWKQVFESIAAASDAVVSDSKHGAGSGRRGSVFGAPDDHSLSVSTCPVQHAHSISITRQLAFGHATDDNETGSPIRRRRCQCDRTCFTMIATATLVALCFACTLTLRMKELDLDKKLVDSWVRREVSNGTGTNDAGIVDRTNYDNDKIIRNNSLPG